MTVAVDASPEVPREQLLRLANSLSLPLLADAEDAAYLLYRRVERLELQSLREPRTTPLHVDFVCGKSRHRRLHGGGRREQLARAVGLQKIANPLVVDATAGLGRDAFVLATLGCRVTMLERSGIIAALLQDGLQRASLSGDEEVMRCVKRMLLIEDDACAWLQSVEDGVDVVYLDPMFPQRRKAALVKKEMRFFQEIVGSDGESHELLRAALRASRRRVVVKRPLKGSYLGELAPSHSIKGKTTRYDVYVKHGQHPE
jgi:16S rRNA (guanine1516-N2)-methyltransferase